MKSPEFFFAGFIITYNRPIVLLRTIEKVLNQSFSIEKLLIIDNGDSIETANVVKELKDDRLSYYTPGFNLGPAGAAAVGLKMLHNEGYKYIYWGDDNDPPPFSDTFQKLIELLLSQDIKTGMVGMVGHRFNSKTGIIVPTENKELQKYPFISVDVIAGNQSMIISSKVLEKNVYPDSSLFFGFEELDFCLSIKGAGFRILVPSELFIRCRQLWKREGNMRPFYKKKNSDTLWREYYTTRNSLYLTLKHKFYLAFLFNLLRFILKSIYGFRYGYRYGITNFVFICKGIIHYFQKKMGKQNF